MKTLLTYTGSLLVLLDDEDYLTWNQFLWGRHHGYACADFRNPGKKPKRLYMHRLIMNPGPWEQVHHKNRCRRDNRKENLEVLSVEEHLQRHPESRSLQSLVAARAAARQQWIDEQRLKSWMIEEGMLARNTEPLQRCP